MGNQLALLGSGNAQVPLAALPQPPQDSNQDDRKYAGAIPFLSSAARVDGYGDLVLFMGDGNVYDGGGYMIADARGEDCTQCLEKGSSEVLILPVPGHCDLYCIITSRWEGLGDDRYMLASILDMSRTNPYWPDRKGRILTVYDLFADRPEFTDWLDGGLEGTFNDVQFAFARYTSGNEKNEYLSMAAIDPQWTTGSLSGNLLLHTTNEKFTRQYRITDHGIEHTWAQEVMPADAFTKDKNRDTDLGKDATNGDLLFACTDLGLVHPNDQVNTFKVLVLRMSGSTGELTGFEGYLPAAQFSNGNGSDGTVGPYGCAFSPDGKKVYFTGDIVEVKIGVIDRVAQTVIDLAPTA